MLIANIPSPESGPHRGQTLITLDQEGWFLHQRVSQRIYPNWVLIPDLGLQGRIANTIRRFRWTKDFIDAVGVLPVCL